MPGARPDTPTPGTTLKKGTDPVLNNSQQPYITLKRTFAAKGITYKDVAAVIKTTEATVMCKLNGSSDFYLSEVLAFCAACDIDPAKFFAEDVA